jgi:hypothetical protein
MVQRKVAGVATILAAMAVSFENIMPVQDHTTPKGHIDILMQPDDGRHRISFAY